MISSSSIKVLLVDDEDFDVSRVKNTINLSSTKIHVENVVSNGRAALEQIQQNPDLFDVVILDYQISGGLRGEELIRKIKELDPFIQIIVITKMTTNTTDFEFANNLLKAGAVWYCTKYPTDIKDFIYPEGRILAGDLFCGCKPVFIPVCLAEL